MRWMENGILIARRYMYAAVPPALRLTAASFGAGLISTNSGFPGGSYPFYFAPTTLLSL